MASMIVGQTLKVKGPKGAMVYKKNMVRAFGMIAGGTGITPMLQIIRAVIRGRAEGDKTQIDLIFANVNAEDILLKEDLDGLAASDDGFRVHYVLNNPPEKWEGGVGFVTPEMMTVSSVFYILSSRPSMHVTPSRRPDRRRQNLVSLAKYKLTRNSNGSQLLHQTSSYFSVAHHP